MHSGFAGAGNKECLDEKKKKMGQEKQNRALRSATPSYGLWFPGAALPASRAARPPPTYGTRPRPTCSPPTPPPFTSPGNFLFLLLKNRASVRINGHPPKLLKRRHYICTDLICGAAMYRRKGRRRSRIPIIWRGGSGGGLAAATGWQRRME